ncbi:LysR family transcriptional regulator [Endozoicomonas sp. OPT23]|uniref:LysR family transcriptional regulator n=1 Tax=Endozoicomonas sp. OPT23 TaxID=2072845 RepID=UPI00129A1018|nr:LysR family transcriptional regulator [Endozoicomonas sp. OPT23]MRI33886.1 LysR family transcriptional regulator [Endozoicomonas sp. OPT23]
MLEKLSASDLNLLPVLQVLLEEKNVTRAAGRLNLSQPAISRNLSRLRELFNDPLFTRTPKGLAPTPRAENLSLQLQRSLTDLSQLIKPIGFDPATAKRQFKLASTDYGAQVFMPSVISRINREAPGVDLEIVPWHEHLIHEMDQQNIDIASCAVTDAPAAVHGRGVGTDKFVCVMGKNHPLLQGGFNLQSYAQAPHALITMGGERKGPIDYLLAEHGLSRRVALRVPHFVAALALVANTDLVLTVPYGLARSCAALYGLEVVPFPAGQESFTYSIIWHERMIRDPGHIWFRQLMYEEMTATIEELGKADGCPIQCTSHDSGTG